MIKIVDIVILCLGILIVLIILINHQSNKKSFLFKFNKSTNHLEKIPKNILQTYHTNKLNTVIRDHIDIFL